MWKYWITMSLLWSSLTSADSQLLEMSTKNVAVVVGQPSNISRQSNPSTDNISQLTFTSSWSTKEFPIWSLGIGADSKNFVDPFTVFKVHSIVTLYLNSTSLNSAGTFTWKATSSSEWAHHHVKKSTAQLIVLDGNPACSSSIRSSVLRELESVEMKCNVRYRGNWAPVMEWMFSGKDDQVVREGVETTDTPNVAVASVFNFTVNHTMNNQNVICKTYFGKYTGNVTNTATNIPDYRYTWTSPALNVTYGPKNLAITPVKESYKPGDKLICSADANPTPIYYKWKDAEKSGQEFVIPSLASPFTVECTASNSVGSNSSSLAIHLSPGLEPQMYLLICLGGLCFLLLLLILLISGKQFKARCTLFCAKRKRNQVTTLNTEADSNGTTFLGNDMTNPQLTLPGNERHHAIYAIVDKKAKKQKKVESADIKTTTNPPQTYIGADQTEYLEMGRFGSLTAGGFVHPDRHPPPMRPRQYEPVVYASIDHDLVAPMPKMKNPK